MLCVSNASLIMQIQLSPNQVKQAFVLMCVCGFAWLKGSLNYSAGGARCLRNLKWPFALHVMENTQIWSAGFVFTCTRSHRMKNWCCITYECSFVYMSGRNPPIMWVLSTLSITPLFLSPPPPVLLSFCFSSSWLHAEGFWWRTPTLPHSSSPYRTGPQVLLSSSSACFSLSYTPCRGERRAAPSGHCCPSLCSEYTTEGEFTSPISKTLILHAV